MLEDIMVTLAERGLAVEFRSAMNGTRVRYSATVCNQDQWSSSSDYPTFEFSVGAWDITTLKDKINDQMEVVEPLVAHAQKVKGRLAHVRQS